MTSFGTFASFATLLLATVYTTSAEFCWKTSYGRGVGTLPNDCGSGNEYDAGLCYPDCDTAAGYYGVGPLCWMHCPDGWTDHGVGCTKPAPYGRGWGYPWQWGDSLNNDGMFERCEEDHGSGGCELDIAIVYPKCKKHFHNVACCVCSPDCPDGFADTGATCIKHTYGRGVGWIPSACLDGKEYQAGLCYPNCDSGYYGVGPVCWGTCDSKSTDCGAACANSAEECFDTITEQVISVLEVVGSIANVLASGEGSEAARTAAADSTIFKVIKKLAKNLTPEQIKKKITELLKDTGEAMAEKSVDAIVKLVSGDDFDWTVLEPTGIGAILKAYNKSICN